MRISNTEITRNGAKSMPIGASISELRLAPTALAAGAPVRDARGVALSVRADDGAAAAAGTARAAIDVPQRPRSVDAGAHLHVRRLEHGRELVIGHVGEQAPRRHARVPERLRFPDVADARHEPLVEQRVTDLALRRRGAEALEHRSDVGRAREDVGTEAARDGRAVAIELEHRAVPEHGLVLLAA